MNLITLENIYKSFSEKPLLTDVKLTITSEDKIGIIGVNGAGKSTLLKIIAGIEQEDSGTITKMNGLNISYLPQHIEFNPEDRVIDHVFNGEGEIMEVLREYEHVLEELKTNSDNSQLQQQLFRLTSKIDALGGWQIESEAKALLTKLGITDFDSKMGKLSGGQRKRVGLCNVLITPCDLLILDEPTNHMDNEIIDYMEELLQKRKGGVIMITHDRYFLDRITNRIFELDRGEIYSYQGNYSVFLEKKAERMQLFEALESKRQNLYRKELAWIKRGAKARSTKQKARIDRFEELKETSYKIDEEKMELNTAGSRLGKKILELDNISKDFGDKVIIKDFSHIFTKEERVGVIGNNGMGKSTLLNIISGRLSPDKGEVAQGETVKIGYFTQENIELDGTMRVIEYIKEIAEYITTNDGSKITASQMLENFLFDGTMQHSFISKLSGGEKRRLYLLRILMEAPNVLFLDEPTNDLDIQTLTILEDYLDRFNGTVIAISHDRYFLDRIANRIFSFEGKGKILELVGNYSDYKEYKDIKAEEEVATSSANKEKKHEENKNRKEKPTKVKFTFKEQKEFDTIDEDIEKKEENITLIEAEINQCGSDFVKLQQLLEDQNRLKEELNFLLERWEYLNEIFEEMERQKQNK
ncbi:ABC-F family ATP-binding cassette domain-containing protein [Clostridium subterminale]|uniref:ABC-F family ATP-binding cassette domain-containing protein n=1 Tax=Clostridium subterminale TaxID=1550 RepID=A0ABN1KYL9_CLOSU